jgi:hypothetical protein
VQPDAGHDEAHRKTGQAGCETAEERSETNVAQQNPRSRLGVRSFPATDFGNNVEICAKAELIAAVEKQHDIWGPSLMALAQAVASARNLVDLINDAQYRLASALAVVERPMM